MFQCCHIVLCQEILEQNRPVCWSIVVKEKPAPGPPFYRAFPFEIIPKLTKDVNVNFFVNSSKARKLYQRIPGTF